MTVPEQLAALVGQETQDPLIGLNPETQLVAKVALKQFAKFPVVGQAVQET